MESYGQRRHDLRIGSKPSYIQADMSDKNSVIISPPIPSVVRDEMATARAKNRQQKLSKSARIFIAGVISFGKEAQATLGKMPENEQERSAQDAVLLRIAERIARESGHPLIGLVVHRDESSVHAHFTLRGFRSEAGKEIPWRFPPQFMSHLQDAAAEEVAHLGIERGKRKIDRIRDGEPKSKWVHRSVRELHEDLPKEIEALREKITALNEDIEKAETKREKNERLAREAEEKKKSAEIYINRESAARAKAAELEKEAADSTRELGEKIKLLETIKTNVADAERQLSERNRALETIGKHATIPALPKLVPEVGEFVTGGTFLLKQTETRQFYPVQQVDEYRKIQAEREKRLKEWAQGKSEGADAKLKEAKEFEDMAIKREANIINLAETIKHLPNSRGSRKKRWSEIVNDQPVNVLLGYNRAPLTVSVIENRYGVAVKIFPGWVIVPAQTPATTAQIAAALYRVTKEKFKDEGWKGAIFTVTSDEMAEKILKMAREDGITGKIEIWVKNGEQEEALFFRPVVRPASPPPQPVRQPEPEAEAPRFGM